MKCRGLYMIVKTETIHSNIWTIGCNRTRIIGFYVCVIESKVLYRIASFEPTKESPLP